MVVDRAFVGFRLPGRAVAGREALLVQGGCIAALGPADEVLTGFAGERVDLDGAVVHPGLRDPHAHLLWLGQSLAALDLSAAGSWAEAVAAVRAAAAGRPPGAWVLGRGWDQARWTDTFRPADLDAAVPDHPVWLARRDGHAGLANAAARAVCGLTAGVVEPPGGRIERGGGGEPTGLLVDAAMGLVEARLPRPDPETRRGWLALAERACLEQGLVAVAEAGAGPDAVAAFRGYAEGTPEGLRLSVMLLGEDDGTGEPWTALPAGPEGVPGDRLRVGAVKLFADGALGSRGAAMEAPFADDPANRGLLLPVAERVQAWGEACLERGLQLVAHVIGDRAVRVVLDGIEAAWGGRPRPELRWRLEHLQTCPPAQRRRLARLGLVPVLNPAHLAADRTWARGCLGEDRWAYSYGIADFVRQGLRPAAGSDFPVVGVSPLATIHGAITGGDGARPDQAVDRLVALEMVTSLAARATFDETVSGSLATGRRADLTVLDRDLLTCPAEEVPAARVTATVIGGEILHRA